MMDSSDHARLAAELPGWRGDENLSGKADGALLVLHEKSPGLSRVLSELPATQTLAAFQAYDPQQGYDHLRPMLRKLGATLVRRFGEQLTLHYGLALLATLIGSHEQRWREDPLQPDLEPYFIDSFHRILAAVARGGARSLMPDTDAFAKELAICLYRMIPAGGQLLEPAAVFPRRLLVGVPWRARISAACYLALKARGFRPFAAFHTDLFLRHRFTPAGFECTFRCLPAVFRSFPALKGAIGISWFLDPALRDISPELCFVREIAHSWGSVFVPVGPDENAEADALMLSPTRRALFEAGEYLPWIHAFVVSKGDILARAATRSAP
jgi:hypothetical protein